MWLLFSSFSNGCDFYSAHFLMSSKKQHTLIISRSPRQSHVFLSLKRWFTPVQDRACYSLWRTIKSQKHSLLTGNNWHHYATNKSLPHARSPPPPFSSCSHPIQAHGMGWGWGSSDCEICLQLLFFPHILGYSTHPKITRLI